MDSQVLSVKRTRRFSVLELFTSPGLDSVPQILVEDFLLDNEEYAYYEDWKLEHCLPPVGCSLRLNTGDPIAMTVRVVMSDAASWELPGLSVKQESFAHAGYRGSTEGLLYKVVKDIEMMRPGYSLPQQLAIDAFVKRINAVLDGRHPFNIDGNSEPVVLIIRDPSGLSAVEGESRGLSWVLRSSFERTWQEECDLGIADSCVPLGKPALQLSTEPEIAGLLRSAQSVVVFSGAGISVESGVTPFRAPGPNSKTGSIWAKFDAAKLTVQNFNIGTETESWWKMKRSIFPEIEAAVPNSAHELFSKLHAKGCLRAVVTQNIDSLHSCGGAVPDNKIIELHGHMRGLICADCASPLNPIPCRNGTCDFRLTAAEVKSAAFYSNEVIVPSCPRCGCPMRTETVMFGQPMPEGAVDRAKREIEACDLLFVIGSTLIVHPANELPAVALRNGIPVVMINFDPTQYDEYVTALVRQPAAAFLAEVAAILCL